MSGEIRDGEYVCIEDFQALVKAFDTLIAAAEAAHKVLVDTPELTPADRYAEKIAADLDDTINDTIVLLEAGIEKAKEFE